MKYYFPTILDLYCTFRIILTVEMFITKKFIHEIYINWMEYHVCEKNDFFLLIHNKENKDFLKI